MMHPASPRSSLIPIQSLAIPRQTRAHASPRIRTLVPPTDDAARSNIAARKFPAGGREK
jgi:hypothetical protein